MDETAAAGAQRRDDEAFEEASHNLSVLGEALKPQLERERKAKELQKQKEEEQLQDAPFRVLMAELSEMFSNEDDLSDGRSELEMTLCRLEKVPGGERSSVCHKERRSPEEAVREGIPDLEGIAMQYAKETGQFGPYAWKIRAWLKGEAVKQTTVRMHVSPPLGYEVPKPKEEPPAPPDPLKDFEKSLTLIATVKSVLGGGESSGSAQGAAAMAKMEAMESHRREIRELEDRHAARLKEAEKEAFERGRLEGERTAREKYERQIWELERDLERAEEGIAPAPDMIDKVVGMIGGPGAVQGLVGGVLQHLAAQPKPPRVPNARERLIVRPPAPQATPNVMPLRPQGQPAPVILNPTPVMVEPTPEQMAEAADTLTQALAMVRNSPEFATSEELQATATALSNLAHHARTASGNQVAEAWQYLNAPQIPHESGAPISWLQLAETLVEADEGEEPMNHDELKALLVERLKEGRSTEAILSEFGEVTDECTREEWKGLLRYVPTRVAVGFLGIPEDLAEKGVEVIEAFKKA